MSIDTSRSGSRLQRPGSRVRGHAAVASREHAGGIKNIVLGVGEGGLLWLLLASIARLAG